MRGKVLRGSMIRRMSGITPAYAGKRFDRLMIKDNSRDHPRLCGEKGLKIILFTSPLGSPPPMRGKATLNGFFHRNPGITPAYAGKRKCVCQTALYTVGSPPPMRGKDGDSVHSRLPFRITPAYAGKSFQTATTNAIHLDHPRLCGEKIFVFRSSAAFAGSPPPMRGKDKFLVCPFRFSGITPAYAGKRRRLVLKGR